MGLFGNVIKIRKDLSINRLDAGESANVIKERYLDSQDPGSKSSIKGFYHGSITSFAEMASKELKLNNEKLAFLEKSGRTETADGETKEELLAANKKLRFVLNYGNSSSATASQSETPASNQTTSSNQSEAPAQSSTVAPSQTETPASSSTVAPSQAETSASTTTPPASSCLNEPTMAETASALVSALNNADALYSEEEFKNDFQNLDDLDGKLQYALGNLSKPPTTEELGAIKGLATALHEYTDRLGHNFEPGSKIEVALGKAEDVAETLLNQVDVALDKAEQREKMEKIKESALDFSQSINKATDDIDRDKLSPEGQAIYDELDALDDSLQIAINGLGENPSAEDLQTTRELAQTVRDKVDQLGHDPKLNDADRALLQEAESKGNQLVKDLKAENNSTESDGDSSAADLAAKEAFTKASQAFISSQIAVNIMESEKDFEFMTEEENKK